MKAAKAAKVTSRIRDFDGCATTIDSSSTASDELKERALVRHLTEKLIGKCPFDDVEVFEHPITGRDNGEVRISTTPDLLDRRRFDISLSVPSRTVRTVGTISVLVQRTFSDTELYDAINFAARNLVEAVAGNLVGIDQRKSVEAITVAIAKDLAGWRKKMQL